MDMDVKAVRNYDGARYPTLEDYYEEKHDSSLLSQLALGAAMAALACVMSGCQSVS